MHPLTPDLSALTDDELHTKNSELMNKLSFAYKMGHSDVVAQIQLVLGDYAIEIEKRNKEMLENAQKTGRVSGDSIDITR